MRGNQKRSSALDYGNISFDDDDEEESGSQYQDEVIEEKLTTFRKNCENWDVSEAPSKNVESIVETFLDL